MIQPIQKIAGCDNSHQEGKNTNTLTNKYSDHKTSSSPSGFGDILNDEIHKLEERKYFTFT